MLPEHEYAPDRRVSQLRSLKTGGNRTSAMAAARLGNAAVSVSCVYGMVSLGHCSLRQIAWLAFETRIISRGAEPLQSCLQPAGELSSRVIHIIDYK